MGTRIKDDCFQKALKTIEKYKMINNEDKIVIGVSGGPDSMCLLDIFLKLKKQIAQNIQKTFFKNIQFDFVVAHINHMIRDEAKEDEIFVKKFCEKNNIQFFSQSIDVLKIANTKKISIEEAGRNARYHFFDEVLNNINGNKIAIAHNKNDRVETVIMNELRGCGIQGLKGIEASRGKYIRPIIECERKDIEEYCNENNLKARIDKTNFENIYTRNKIRNIVIPYIEKEFNPNIINTIDRLSNLVIEQEEYIKKQVNKIYYEILIRENIDTEDKKNQKKISLDGKEKKANMQIDADGEKKQKYIVLDLKKFNRQEKVIKSNLILYAINKILNTTKGIEKIHLDDIIKLCDNNIGNKFLMPNKKLKIYIKNGNLKISKQT